MAFRAATGKKGSQAWRHCSSKYRTEKRIWRAQTLSSYKDSRTYLVGVKRTFRIPSICHTHFLSAICESVVLQVLGKVFELIALLANESSKLSKKDAFTAITGLVDKMSDIKLKGPAGEALTAMSEALGPQFVFTQLHKRASAHKNPKVCLSILLPSAFVTCALSH